MSIPILSLVIPVYNEQARIARCLEECFRFLPRYISSWELIVVDDGSTDNTWAILEHHKAVYSHMNIIRNPHRGKGHAVRTGMLFGRGEYRAYMDCDLSTPLTELRPAIETITRADVVIGSRELDTRRVKAAWYRRIMGRVFHTFVTDLVPGIRDTQCGFKMFRDYAAKDIFESLTLDGFAFDVEALYLAQQKGYTVIEMPVAWDHDVNSKVRIVGDSLRMLRDVATIPNRHKNTTMRTATTQPE